MLPFGRYDRSSKGITVEILEWTSVALDIATVLTLVALVYLIASDNFFFVQIPSDAGKAKEPELHDYQRKAIEGIGLGYHLKCLRDLSQEIESWVESNCNRSPSVINKLLDEVDPNHPLALEIAKLEKFYGGGLPVVLTMRWQSFVLLTNRENGLDAGQAADLVTKWLEIEIDRLSEGTGDHSCLEQAYITIIAGSLSPVPPDPNLNIPESATPKVGTWQENVPPVVWSSWNDLSIEARYAVALTAINCNFLGSKK